MRLNFFFSFKFAEKFFVRLKILKVEWMKNREKCCLSLPESTSWPSAFRTIFTKVDYVSLVASNTVLATTWIWIYAGLRLILLGGIVTCCGVLRENRCGLLMVFRKFWTFFRKTSCIVFVVDYFPATRSDCRRFCLKLCRNGKIERFYLN